MRAVSPKKIREPEIAHDVADALEPFALVPLAANMVIEQCRIDGGAFEKSKCDSIRIDGARIATTSFEESKLSSTRWIDVICERSSFAMIDWRGAGFTRVVLRGCRVTGAKFYEGVFEDVTFVDCQIDYGSFGDAKFSRVAFENCQLRDADFHAADLRGVTFVDCDLERADFTRAKLQTTDVSQSSVRGITISAVEARGLVVNRDQASVLAALFGLVIRD
jgi:uncharacterized protein YjbI with pentapeptide repeats